MITTVSSPEKAVLASAAGAHHVVNYRAQEAEQAIRSVAPEGVDIIVEVAPVQNAAIDASVIAPNGTVSIYASGPDALAIAIGPAMSTNARYQFVLVYTMPGAAKEQAVRDVNDAATEGAIRVGAEAGLPLHNSPSNGPPTRTRQSRQTRWARSSST